MGPTPEELYRYNAIGMIAGVPAGLTALAFLVRQDWFRQKARADQPTWKFVVLRGYLALFVAGTCWLAVTVTTTWLQIRFR